MPRFNNHDRNSPDLETGFEIEVFYDGDCPLCRREMNFLRRLDRSRHIRFQNIARIDFPESDLGRSYEQLMSEIHGRLPDGTWLVGVEVFRRLYSTTGWSWLVTLTRLPLTRDLLEWTYRWFARNRLKLTGRCAQRDCVSRTL